MKTSIWLAPVGVLAASICASGCGGGSGGSCGAAPCGGDLVGAWNFSDICLDEAALSADFQAFCAGASISALNISYTGSIEFTAGNYTVDATSSQSFTVSFAVACLNGGTCADYAAALEATADPGTTASCSGTTTCTCMVDTGPQPAAESGGYTVSGNTVTTTPSDGSAADTLSYCVKGDTVNFMEIEGDQTVVELVAQRD
jgi:hypothetical protein